MGSAKMRSRSITVGPYSCRVCGGLSPGSAELDGQAQVLARFLFGAGHPEYGQSCQARQSGNCGRVAPGPLLSIRRRRGRTLNESVVVLGPWALIQKSELSPAAIVFRQQDAVQSAGADSCQRKRLDAWG